MLYGHSAFQELFRMEYDPEMRFGSKLGVKLMHFSGLHLRAARRRFGRPARSLVRQVLTISRDDVLEGCRAMDTRKAIKLMVLV